MKVIDLLNKLDDLKNIRDDLEKRVNADDVTGYDSDLMDKAADAINEFILELYHKEVKV